jgi:hypothetical protein
VNVEGIGDGDPIGEHIAQRGGVRRRNGREIQIQCARYIGGHGHVAARRAHHQHLAAGERTAGMKHLERFAQRTQRVAARDAGLTAKGLEYFVGTSQRPGMAVRGARRRGGAAGFDDGDGFARGARQRGGARKSLRVLNALEVQTEGRYACIVA